VSGPTVEGSIVAKVQADISNLEENISLAQAKIEELTGKKPDVTVKANVDTALTKLQAVEAATDRAANANTRLTAAVKALEISESSESRKAATLLPIRKEATAALDEATAASLALAAAQAALAKEEEKAAAAGARSKAAGGNGPASFFQLALVAVAALVPLLASLAGYVAAVTGAFAGMGAAGVLAVLGIKNAITQGTAAGNAFSGGLHILKGDLDQLSNTSATAMLVSFQRAVDMIDSAMPSLNGEIKLFSGLLGTTGDIVLSTLISGFKTLLPLFLQAGVYIEQVAVGFQKWTTGGGLAQWARDASVALPQVSNSLGSLLHGIISVMGALQPLGTVMLGIIGIVGNLLTFLSQLGPAFPVIVAGALAAYGAFQLFTNVPPVVNLVSKAVTALGISTDVALGPIGWVAAGIAALAAVALTATAATNNATQAMDTYTAAVQQDAGVIGEHTKAQAASNLQTSGALAIASKLGIATKTLTDATLGNGEAQAVVAKKIKDLTAELKAMDQANAKAADTTAGAQTQAAAKLADQIQKLTAEYAAQQTSIKDAIKAYNDIQTALGGTTITTKAQLDAQTALASSYGDSLPVYLAAKGAQKQAEDQLKATTAAMVQENDASSLLANALTLLNGGSLSVAQAQTGLSAANNSLIDSFKQNGQAVDGSTKSAVANQQAIQQQVQAAQQAAEAIGKQTGSSEKAVQAYKDSKQAIEDQLKAQGDLTPAVQAYIDKLYDVANLKVPPTKLDVDTATAEKKVADLLLFLQQKIPTNIRLGVKLDASANATDVKQRAGGGVTGLGELTLVGEKGPEWARFPTGTSIYPNGVKPVMSSSRVTNSQTTNNQGGRQITINPTAIVQADPRSAMQDLWRQVNMRVA